MSNDKFCPGCGQKVSGEMFPERTSQQPGPLQYPAPYGAGYPQPTIIVAVPPPQPKGYPTKKFYYIGSIGIIFAIIGALLMGSLFVLSFTYPPYGDPEFWRGLFISSEILLGIGSVITGVGFYGFYHNYGQNLGIASLSVSVLAAIFWFIAAGIMVGIEYGDDIYFIEFIGSIILGFVFSGVMLIVQGVNIYTARHYTGNPGLATAETVISIIAGAFCCSVIMVILFGAGFFVWTAAYVLLIIVFLKASLPQPGPMGSPQGPPPPPRHPPPTYQQPMYPPQ